MTNVILKRSAVPGKTPTTGDLALGEIAINTYDGKMFIKKDDGVESIVEIGAGTGDVTGPGSTTDNAVARFNGTTGTILQNSGVIIDDSDNMSGIGTLDTTNDITINKTGSAATLNIITNLDAGALAQIAIQGHDSGGAGTTYGQISVEVSDNTDTQEYGIMKLQAVRAGSLHDWATYDAADSGIGRLDINAYIVTPYNFFVNRTAAESQIYLDSDLKTAADVTSSVRMRGYNSVNARTLYAKIESVINSPTSGAEYGRLDFKTIVAGTIGTGMTLAAGLQVGTPTGGDKGAGTINATAVYDDNTLLTCYVFDQAVEGDIDEAKWHSKVPNKIIPARERAVLDENGNNTGETELIPAREEERRHDWMLKFKSRIGTKYDPLDLDCYAQHWKDKKHLTAMPNEANFDPLTDNLSSGEWIQRLVETVETQAVLIEKLNQRDKDQQAMIDDLITRIETLESNNA